MIEQSPLNLLILALVCYRLSRLITLEDGPFDIFLIIQNIAGARDFNSNGRIRTWHGRLISCPYCLGVWVAIPLAIIYSGIQWYSLLIWLAIAGLQSVLQSLEK